MTQVVPAVGCQGLVGSKRLAEAAFRRRLKHTAPSQDRDSGSAGQQVGGAATLALLPLTPLQKPEQEPQRLCASAASARTWSRRKPQGLLRPTPNSPTLVARACDPSAARC